MAAADGCPAINAAIAALPAAGGQVVLSSGTFVCLSPINIDRDNVTLQGQGYSTTLRLADGANAPVLVLGQMSRVPEVTRRHIRVADLQIDGNRAAQTRECMEAGPCSATNVLRNNGITPRGVSDVIIERVLIHNARSGGLVCELGCTRVTVRDLISRDNYFDGLAGYETQLSTFSNVFLVNNCAAGLSTDIRFNRNSLTNVVISREPSQMNCSAADQTIGSVGMFIRDSNDNVFMGLQIHNQREHGIFIAQVDLDPTTAARGNVFSDMVISNSGGYGMFVANASCTDNMVNHAQFVGNAAGCLFAATGADPQLNGTICR